MRRKRVVQYLLCALFFVASAGLAWHYARKLDDASVLRAGSRTYMATYAVTEAEQQKGLGGVKHMPGDAVMVFVYEREHEACFWMKDMQFSLDMVWLDSDKKIVRIMEQVAPGTYPQSYCAHAQYVVEFRAGEVERAGLHKGQTLSF